MVHKILKNPQAVIGLALIVLICAVALLAPILAPNDPNAVNPLLKYQPASAQFPLGTDQLGRCELSRLLYGARASLGLAFPILILLGGIGLILGMMTACIGGRFDQIITGISQIFIAFPTLIIAVAIIGILGDGLQNIVWAVVISMWARFMQLIRTYAKTELSRDYVTAAKVSGCGMWQIIFPPSDSKHPAPVFSVLFNRRCLRHPHRVQLFLFGTGPAQRNSGVGRYAGGSADCPVFSS